MLQVLCLVQFVVPPESTGAIANVRLPIRIPAAQLLGLHKRLLDEHKTYFKILDWSKNGDAITYVRVSAQIYLDMSDFVFVGDVIDKLLGNVSVRSKM